MTNPTPSLPPQRGASAIKHPLFAATRRYLAAHPFPQQRKAVQS